MDTDRPIGDDPQRLPCSRALVFDINRGDDSFDDPVVVGTRLYLTDRAARNLLYSLKAALGEG